MSCMNDRLQGLIFSNFMFGESSQVHYEESQALHRVSIEGKMKTKYMAVL